ncbi:hypothetical protein [Desulfobacter curvatus]|uniref:hypothetical protein n=1 Tax=Desulfobacter curvatus TaxID=2290 RepID=UPI000381391E|nr:hypothetical protein [Desulfobacter curvatus]
MPKFKLLLYITCISLMYFITGCASSKAPDYNKIILKNFANLDNKCIVLATSRASVAGGKHTLLPTLFLIDDEHTKESQKYRFSVTGPHHRFLSEDRSYYLHILELDEGNMLLHSIRGKVLRFDSITGDPPRFEAPILLNFDASKKQIIYIGNIHMFLRNKKLESEIRSGPFTPIFSQAGVDKTTFDIQISDQYERDIDEFEKKCPNFSSYNVNKQILPAWKRPSKEEFIPAKTHFFFY